MSRPDLTRILSTGLAPGARAYEVRPAKGGSRIVAFVTAGVNGKSADDTAIDNLADMSEQVEEELALFVGGALPTYSNGATLLATASGGVIRLVAS